MASLTGSSVASTYTTLLKLTTASLGADASAKYIEDAGGTDSALSLSTTRVGIGTATPAVKLEVSAASGESWIKVASVANAHAGFLIYQENAIKNYIYHSTTDHLRITDGGDDHGVEMADGETDWTAIGSDARLKTNWELFEDALGKINKLETIGTYQWIDPVTNELTHPNLRNVGFTAQEVQEILPDRIKKFKRKEKFNDDTEYMTFCYQDLFVLAVKAIQELSAKVTALENA